MIFDILDTNMVWVIPLSLLIIFELIADYFAKSWSVKGGLLFAVVALVSYLVANSFWLFALKNGSGLARGAVLFSVASAVIAVLLGMFLFHENISARGYIGIIFGIIAITLLFY